jgi:hypothetical protein
LAEATKVKLALEELNLPKKILQQTAPIQLGLENLAHALTAVIKHRGKDGEQTFLSDGTLAIADC